MRSQVRFQFGGPLLPGVKNLLIVNLVSWVVLILIIQNWFMKDDLIFKWFGLIPESTIMKFHVWQPLTYMFLHSTSVFHVLFNMLVLWMFGAELEGQWGTRRFLIYYIGCGLGAAAIYLAGAVIYFLVSNNPMVMLVPVVGASGAVFGLMLAYGILFGEREIYFLGLFPMKAKIFVLIIGAVEVLNLLSEGLSSRTANLAHLGGLVTGFLILKYWSARPRRPKSQTRGRNLRLVVDNEAPKHGPRYWN